MKPDSKILERKITKMNKFYEGNLYNVGLQLFTKYTFVQALPW